MIVDKKTITNINNCLDRGDKQKLASHLGIMPQALSRHLTTRNMTRLMLNQIKSYILTLK